MTEKLKNIFKMKYYFLTAVLIFFSFPTYNIWIFKGFAFFAWFSLIPLFLYIREKSYKEILISSFVTGFIGILLVYKWIGDFGANVNGGNYFLLILLIPSLTVFFITKIIVAEFLSRKFENLRIFIFPSIWIFIDWIESIGFLAFPLTYWGYSQYQFNSFIQISSCIGIMGITFILIFFNSIISDFFYKHLYKKINLSIKSTEVKTIGVFLFILLLIIVHGKYVLLTSETKDKKNIKIAAIQSCISPWENWNLNRFNYLGYLEQYTAQALENNPDIIIWSESATLEYISYHYKNSNLNLFERRVLEIAKASHKPLLTGEIGIIEDIINNRYYPQNNAVLINENGEVVDSYAKINLVPFGEWFPYQNWLPYLKELRVKFGASDFEPGTKPLLLSSLNKKFGALICYEGIFYRLCSKYKKLGADFLVNITNYGWTSSYAGHMQLFSASIFRAIENGIWFVSAGNTGPTALIDPYGRIVDSIPILEKSYLVSDINLSQNHKTFFSTHGDIFLYVGMFFLFVILIIIFKNFIQIVKKNS